MDNLQDINTNKQKGYVKIWRTFIESPMWKSERVKTRSMAWLHIIVKANHKTQKVPIGHEEVQVLRGDVFTSQQELAENWGWSRGKVRSFLDYLKKHKMIDVYTTTKFTIIKVINYGEYNDSQESPIFFGSVLPEEQPTNNQQNTQLNNSLSNNYDFEQPAFNHSLAHTTTITHELNQPDEHLNNSNSIVYTEQQPYDNQVLANEKPTKSHQKDTNNNGKNGNNGKEIVSNNFINNNEAKNFEKNNAQGEGAQREQSPPVPPAPPNTSPVPDVSRYGRIEIATKKDFTIEECWELFKYDNTVASISRDVLFGSHPKLREDPALFERYGQRFLWHLKIKLISQMALPTFSTSFHFWFNSNISKTIEQLENQTIVKNKNNDATGFKGHGKDGTARPSNTGYESLA